MLLLEQMQGINATMEQSKTDTLLADYADKLNKLQARAEDVTPAAPQDITDLMDLLEETRAGAQDNAGRADALVPRSQEDFADVEDLGRSVREVPDKSQGGNGIPRNLSKSLIFMDFHEFPMIFNDFASVF